MIPWLYTFLFSIRVFFHGHWQLTAGEGRIPSTTSTRSRTFRQLFATLHLRWLSHIFNRITCIYQAALLLDEIYHCIELLFDWCDVDFRCLLVDLILDFVTAIWLEKPVGLVPASTIILVLQANQLIKCASHPNVKYTQNEHVFYITYIQNEHRI